MPVLRRGARELCVSPALQLLGARWGDRVPGGQPGVGVPTPYPIPASFGGPFFWGAGAGAQPDSEHRQEQGWGSAEAAPVVAVLCKTRRSPWVTAVRECY